MVVRKWIVCQKGTTEPLKELLVRDHFIPPNMLVTMKDLPQFEMEYNGAKGDGGCDSTCPMKLQGFLGDCDNLRRLDGRHQQCASNT